MTSYINISNIETDPEAPLTSELAKKWRDNPIAAFEGDATAVAAGIVLRDAALGLTPTTAGRDWVVARMLLAGTGGVGAYLLLSNQSTPGALTSIEVGTTVAGSSLFTVRLATG